MPATSVELNSTRAKKSKSSIPVAYVIVIIFLIIGFSIRDDHIIDASYGVGYWLGIIGGSMMLVLLIYPFRKRIRGLRLIGAIKHWFRIHMMFGLFGPLLILYHANFSLGSVNSQVAMFCMLTVAGSGLIGRHLYSHIHHGLYGRKASLREFQSDLNDSQESDGEFGLVAPQAIEALEAMATDLLKDEPGVKIGFGQSLLWALGHPLLRRKIKRGARREIANWALQQAGSAKEKRKHTRLLRRHINKQYRNMRRVAQFRFYERMFALWHILHLPLFFMLILSAVAHVFAVHMY